MRRSGPLSGPALRMISSLPLRLVDADLAERDVAVGRGLPREAKQPLADHVALHLVGPARNREDLPKEIALAAVDRLRVRPVGGDGSRARELHTDPGTAKRRHARENLQDPADRAGNGTP